MIASRSVAVWRRGRAFSGKARNIRSSRSAVAPAEHRATLAAPTTPRCIDIGTCAHAARAPRPAPATVPTLHQPCNRVIQCPPIFRSTVTPWTFIAASQAPLARPSPNRTPTSWACEPARPTPTSARLAAEAETNTTRPLPNRQHASPASGMDTSVPAPSTNSATPRPVRSVSSRSRIAGRRDNHEAWAAPLTAKTSAVPDSGRTLEPTRPYEPVSRRA